jgi:ATP-dependent DNA helicase RecG
MPFTYDGRAYQRIGTTTSVMPQETYQRLRHRGGTIGSSRLGSGGGFSRTARTPGQWTDTQCGCCGFWTAISPGLPQCQLRLARFRGLDKAEFNNQRQVHEHALQLMSEAMDFLSRHLPLAGRIEPGVFERVDEPLLPPVALREALVNTFCHRDYSHGAVSVAVYDDRLEIWSDGTTIRAAPGRSETRPSFTSTQSLDRRGVLSAGVGGTLGAGHAKTG